MKKVPEEKKFGEEEFDEGYNVCNRGLGRHNNPYVVDSEAYEWWRRGWENRYYNEPSEKW